jgi:hypothetical protein
MLLMIGSLIVTNREAFEAALASAEIDSHTTEVNGQAVWVSEDSSMHSSDVRQTLYVEHGDDSYTRTGTKIISYDNWVDTVWGDWERG